MMRCPPDLGRCPSCVKSVQMVSYPVYPVHARRDKQGSSPCRGNSDDGARAVAFDIGMHISDETSDHVVVNFQFKGDTKPDSFWREMTDSSLDDVKDLRVFQCHNCNDESVTLWSHLRFDCQMLVM
jgi:hypothetical protein